MLTIRTIQHDSREYWETIELRRRVLREPLGLDFDPDDLAKESADLHVAAFEAPNLVGCLVLTLLDEVRIKMRQVAVDSTLQGFGIGTHMVAFSESLARTHGYKEMVLNARDTAVPFYLRLDYEIVGEPFEEVTIPHLRMMKRL
jgi:predicted GNAT family N-acyltransferase